MKRVVAVVLVGLALLAACGEDEYWGTSRVGGVPRTGPSGSTSSATSSGTTGRPHTGDHLCSDRPLCGGGGCCPPSWRCLRDRCVPPGIRCSSDADCSIDRYCATELLEPRCFEREVFCEDGDLSSDCIRSECDMDLSLSLGRAVCAEVLVQVHNFGRKTVPAGATIAIELTTTKKPEIGDDDGDAAGAGDAGTGDAGTGDAGSDAGPVPHTVVMAGVPDGILPGELTLIGIPVAIDYQDKVTARVISDPDAGFVDCNRANDRYNVSNLCGEPK